MVSAEMDVAGLAEGIYIFVVRSEKCFCISNIK